VIVLVAFAGWECGAILILRQEESNVEIRVENKHLYALTPHPPLPRHPILMLLPVKD
jgi:hypothetical protein